MSSVHGHFISIAHLLLRVFLQLLPGSNTISRDLEIVVLRHQLQLLRRQVARPDLRRRDRVFLAALRVAGCRGSVGRASA